MIALDEWRILRNLIIWFFRWIGFQIQLLEELQKVAASSIEIRDNRLIIKHLYTERYMTPLNIYLENATDE